MVRTLIISGILLALLVLTSCGKEKSFINLNTALSSTNSVHTDKVKNKDTKKEDTVKDSQAQKDGNAGLGAGVIAKSGNAVSSGDKEEVIEELDKELDSLFKSINDSKD